MLRAFRQGRSRNWEWSNVEIQVCWNPATWVNAHLESKYKRFALVFVRETWHNEKSCPHDLRGLKTFLFSKRETVIFYANFISFVLWRIRLFLCEIFSQAPNLQSLHLFLVSQGRFCCTHMPVKSPNKHNHILPWRAAKVWLDSTAFSAQATTFWRLLLSILNFINLTFHLNCLILTGFRSKKNSTERGEGNAACYYVFINWRKTERSSFPASSDQTLNPSLEPKS